MPETPPLDSGKKQYRRRRERVRGSKTEKVKRQLQDELSAKTPPSETEDSVQTIEKAISLFLIEKKVQDVSDGVHSRYECDLGRFKGYCEQESIFTAQRITRELLTGYAATWANQYGSSNTRAAVRDRLRGFLRYCYECQWLKRVPAVPKIDVDKVPTLPLTNQEYARLLKSIEKVKPMRWDAKGDTRALSAETKQRLRALIQLMRWSGLAIQDALTLERSKLSFDRSKSAYRVVTARTKTGTDVSVLMPPKVGKEIAAVKNDNQKYIFWTGAGKRTTVARMWGRRFIRPLFTAAGLADGGHMLSHRLRDTFAADLLSKGVPLEEVSKLLGHTSIKTTEKRYSAWVKGRQDRLDFLIIGTWGTSRKRTRERRARQHDG